MPCLGGVVVAPMSASVQAFGHLFRIGKTMLSYKLLKNRAGLLLIGDYTSLQCLHEVVHDINERSPLIADKEGAFLGLAYEVRKAFERQRQVLKPAKGYEEMGVRYGAELLWPVLLLQQRLLRQSLGYVDHGKGHQAMAYALEAVIEDGLKEDFGIAGESVIARWQRIDMTHPDVLPKLDSRGGIFCSWTKAQRTKRFVELLDSFDPAYESHYRLRASRGDPDLLSPTELAQWEGMEWPDPRW